MNEAMADVGLAKPAITYDELFFFISFKRQVLIEKDRESVNKKSKVTERVTEKVTERVTENQAIIIKEMKSNKYTTISKLSKIAGISERKIKENIRILKNKGIIRRIGPDRGGHWEIVNVKTET